MKTQSNSWIITLIASALACGYLVTNSHTVLAEVTIGSTKQTSQTQYTRQVYSIDQWPAVREKLCNKCQKNTNPEQEKQKNRVSVPEPSSVISLLIIGCSLLLIKRTSSTDLGSAKKQ